jgi:hypothetical protein
MIRDYLEGHRKPYFKPFQLLFVLSAIFLIYMQVTLPDELNRFKEFSEQGFNTNVMAESVDTTSMNEEQKNMIDYMAANYFKVANFISKIEVPPSVKKIFNMTKNWVSGNLAATILMLLPFWYLATKRTFRKTEYGKKIDLVPLAETWECSAHPDGPSVVMNGEHSGKTLIEVISAHPEYLGTHSLSITKG